MVENETPTERYQHLIDANQETAEEMIPIKKRKKKRKTSADKRVEVIRNEVNEAFDKCNEQPANENREKLQSVKKPHNGKIIRCLETEIVELLALETRDHRLQF